MAQYGYFGSLAGLKSLQIATIFRPNVPFNNVLYEANFFNTIFDPMQLCNDFISFLNEIASNRFRKVKNTAPIGVSNFQNAMKLYKDVHYVVIMWPKDDALVTDQLLASLTEVNEGEFVMDAAPKGYCSSYTVTTGGGNTSET